MKLRRTLNFTKRHISVERTGPGLFDYTYKTISNEVLTKYAISKAEKHNCIILDIRFTDSFSSGCLIAVAAHKKDFLAFVNDYVTSCSGYIEDLAF